MFSVWTIIFLLFGFFLLIKSADYLIDGAAGLAKQAKIPKIVIGLSLVAFGTSAPEFTVSLISAVQGNSDIGLGNVIGSNIANIALVLAVAAIFKNVPVTKSTLTRGIPLSFLAMFALLVLGYDVWFHGADVGQNFLSLGDGLIFLSFFIIFVYYVYGDLKSTQIQEEEIQRIERKWYQKKWWYLALLVGGGLLGLIIGGKLIVDNAVITAQFLGVSEALIGLTIIAIGTSLPELAIVVVAAMKHENDLAVGSIIGSNIFNIFLVLGGTAVVRQIDFDPKLILDLGFAFLVTVFFYLFLLRKRKLTRLHGTILIGLYVIYLVSLSFREVVSAYLHIAN